MTVGNLVTCKRWISVKMGLGYKYKMTELELQKPTFDSEH